MGEIGNLRINGGHGPHHGPRLQVSWSYCDKQELRTIMVQSGIGNVRVRHGYEGTRGTEGEPQRNSLNRTAKSPGLDRRRATKEQNSPACPGQKESRKVSGTNACCSGSESVMECCESGVRGWSRWSSVDVDKSVGGGSGGSGINRSIVDDGQKENPCG